MACWAFWLGQVLFKHFGLLKLSAVDPIAVFFKILEQHELRTLEWKKEQACDSSLPGLPPVLQDLEGDVLLFADLLRYAKLADITYAPNEALFPCKSFARGLFPS